MNIEKLNALPTGGQLIARNLLREFGSMAAASRILKFRRPTLYEWMTKGEISADSKARIKQLGYSPRTFKRINSN